MLAVFLELFRMLRAANMSSARYEVLFFRPSLSCYFVCVCACVCVHVQESASLK